MLEQRFGVKYLRNSRAFLGVFGLWKMLSNDQYLGTHEMSLVGLYLKYVASISAEEILHDDFVRNVLRGC